MKKVYLVSRGTYSDYSVVAIFSTKKKATEFIRMFPSDFCDYNDIAVFDLDPDAVDRTKNGEMVWRVVMLRDGTVERVRSERFYAFAEPGRRWVWRRTKAPAYKHKNIPDALVADCWAKDEKHAIKIVNEWRTQMIASGEWK